LPGLGLVENGVIAVQDGRILYAGEEASLPFPIENAAEIIDCGGRWITPGLIDCHTHLVHAGDRANEFEMRLAGATYEEVARAGGGIVSSVRSLREASEDQLVEQTLPRLDALMAEGVTTVEIKSGYGLDLENEAKALRAARRLSEERDVTVRTTFLGAHALPPEFKGDKAGYIAKVVNEMLPAIAVEGLADAVDGFCEGIAFSTDEMRLVFDAAKAHGLPVSCTPISFPTCMAQPLPPNMVRCRPIISNIPMKPAQRRWQRAAPLPSSCPARSTLSARRRSRQSSCSARQVSPWRSPPTTIRAPRR
jgi:imidazolonepropionase